MRAKWTAKCSEVDSEVAKWTAKWTARIEAFAKLSNAPDRSVPFVESYKPVPG